MSHNPPSTRHSILPPTHPSLHSSSSQSTQTTHLQSRIAAKRTELTHLLSLRDLSSQMASQMADLENKLSMLKDGTEAVSCILANWENVMRAIGMASGKVVDVVGQQGEEREEREGEREGEGELPVTLVRIPVGQGEGAEG